MEGKKKGEGGEGEETEKESSEKKHCPRFRAFSSARYTMYTLLYSLTLLYRAALSSVRERYDTRSR